MCTHRRCLEREQPNGPTYLLQLLPRLIELQLGPNLRRRPSMPALWCHTAKRLAPNHAPIRASLQKLRRLRDVGPNAAGLIAVQPIGRQAVRRREYVGNQRRSGRARLTLETTLMTHNGHGVFWAMTLSSFLRPSLCVKFNRLVAAMPTPTRCYKT
jgi:hypothetical protein